MTRDGYKRRDALPAAEGTHLGLSGGRMLGANDNTA